MQDGSSSSSSTNMTNTISEQQVIDGFHAFLKTALAQAKAERILDVDTLASAEADIMISGPALSLFFGAIRSTTDPPSVPLPRRRRESRSTPLTILSHSSCPPAFLPYFQVWAAAVPTIQELPSQHRHDLARVICGLPPLSSPPHPRLNRIAADLRAVAIEISQRRTFQERYQADLQAAIDTSQLGNGTRHSKSPSNLTAHFVPPPMYEEKDDADAFPNTPPLPPPKPPKPKPPRSPTSPADSSPSVPAAASTDPALTLIRETLYASLADVLASTPSLHHTLTSDPPRAYFASVALAILNVALTSLTPDGGVRGVLGHILTPTACPPPLRPLMREFATLAADARRYADEDDEDAVRLAARGKLVPEPRMDRIRGMLESGVGYEERGRGVDGAERRSAEGRALQFVNRVNALALQMTELPAFRAYAKDVFDVLRAVW